MEVAMNQNQAIYRPDRRPESSERGRLLVERLSRVNEKAYTPETGVDDEERRLEGLIAPRYRDAMRDPTPGWPARRRGPVKPVGERTATGVGSTMTATDPQIPSAIDSERE